MKAFKVVWLSGRIEFLKGRDIITALTNARHSKFATRAIRNYEEVKVMARKEKKDDRWCSDFKEFLAEEVGASPSISKRPSGKDKRAQRIADKKRYKVRAY